MDLFLAFVALSGLASTSPFPGIDPCTLVAPADIAAALGAAPAAGRKNPVGPSLDEDTGAMVTACSLAVGNGMLMVAVAEFGSKAAAGQAMTRLANQKPDDPADFVLTELAGVGERALRGANAEGAMVVILRGKFLLNLMFSEDGGQGSNRIDGLKRLATAAVRKL